MHRRTTSRRENKRIVSKRQRAAERQVINGGYSKIIRGDNWAYRGIQPPIIDEIPKGHPKHKGKRIKIVCSSGPKGKHQYLKDIGVFKSSYTWYDFGGPEEEIKRYKMCVHCGQIKVKSHSKWGPHWYRSVNKLLRSANELERATI